MTAIVARQPISTGSGPDKIVIPKGTKGMAKCVSNSTKIRESFPDIKHKDDGWFYICCFPEYIDEILCYLTQIEII